LLFTFSFSSVLGIEPRALCKLGKCSTTELHPSLLLFTFSSHFPHLSKKSQISQPTQRQSSSYSQMSSWTIIAVNKMY
jgi:hypothetical protein